jgi:polyhydroxybutyrate depolymerase
MTRRRTFACGIWICGLFATLCSCAGLAADGRIERLVTEAGEQRREALLWTPVGAAPERLVVMLHGAGGNPDRIRALTGQGLEREAQRGRWLVLYPQGVAGTWNDCRRSPDYPARRAGVDDVAFLAGLLERVRAEYRVARERVLVAGYSNGAHMALRLGLERPDVLGGIGMVAALPPAPEESLCPQAYPDRHVLLIVGTEDPLIPHGGGASRGIRDEPLGMVLSAPDAARVFARALGAAPTVVGAGLPEADGDPLTGAAMSEWRAPRGRLLRVYTLYGAGHVIPQQSVRLPPAVGRSAGDIDFGRVVLDFVSAW